MGLALPGHQHPWYWPDRLGKFLSYLRKDFNYLSHVNVEEWYKMQIYVFVPSKKFSTQKINTMNKTTTHQIFNKSGTLVAINL